MNILEKYLDYWMGKLLIAIGKGNLRDEVARLILEVNADAYNRGKRAARPRR